MRSTLVFVSCILLGLSTVHAQISLGFKAGANLAHQNIQDIDIDLESDEITGYNWGVLLEIPFGRDGNFNLQPEVLLVQKGGKLTLQDIKTTLNYIDVPILLKLKVLNSNLLHLNVLGGPSFGYATSGEQLKDNTIISINFGEDNIKRFDLGMHAGGGIGLNLGSLGVFADVRYLFGISDVDASSRMVKNEGLNISAGLMFRLVGR